MKGGGFVLKRKIEHSLGGGCLKSEQVRTRGEEGGGGQKTTQFMRT